MLRTRCSQAPSCSRGCCPGRAGRSGSRTRAPAPRTSATRSLGTRGPTAACRPAPTPSGGCRTGSASSAAWRMVR